MNENWQTTRRLLGYYPRVLKLVWAASPRYAFFTTLFAVLSSLANPAQIWLSKIIIDTIIETIQTRLPDSAIDWSALFIPVGALVCVLVLGEAGRRVAEALEEVLRFRVEHYAHYLLLEKAAQLDIAFYESPEFFDQLDRARNDLARTMNLAKVTTDSVGQFLSLAVTLGLVTQLHPLAGLLMLLVSVPQLIVSSQYATTFFSLSRSKFQVLRENSG